jgi:2-haloacid dehalogenase
MPEALGFDIYGTLVDPLDMREHLEDLLGDRAGKFSEIWRDKQIEYSFRRGLMRRYEDFGVCTRQALVFAMRSMDVVLSESEREGLLEEYQNLQAFPDVAPGLEKMKLAGHTVVTFSNGVEATTRTLLDRSGVLPYLHDVLSVDDVKTFKPDPEAYHYLARRLERPAAEVWLVSSNPFDVIGAKSAGLRAAWVKRRPDAIFDPWDIEPDLVVGNLEELAAEL